MDNETEEEEEGWKIEHVDHKKISKKSVSKFARKCRNSMNPDRTMDNLGRRQFLGASTFISTSIILSGPKTSSRGLKQ